MNYIEIYMFVVSFGVYLYNPIFSNLIFQNFCVYRNGGTVVECRKNKTLNDIVQKDIASYKEIKQWSLLVTTFLSPIVVNFLSTRFYPEKLLLLPSVHFAFGCIIGIIYTVHPQLDLKNMIPLYFVLDIMGLSSTVRSLMSYYLVHTCSEENLQSRLVLADSAFILSLSFSGLAKGYVEKSFGYLYSAVLCLSLIVFAYLFSLILERSRIRERKYTISVQSLKQSAKDAYQIMQKHPFTFWSITITQFLYPFAEVGAAKMIMQYTNLTKFHITKPQQGHVLFLLSFVRGIGSLFIPVLLKYFKFKHWLLCFISSPLQLGYYIMYGLAPSLNYLYIGPTFLLFQDVFQPMFCYVVAKMFRGQSQAILIAFHFGLGAFAKRFGGVVGPAIFKATIENNPGFLFFFFGSVSFLSTLLGTIGSYHYLKNAEAEDKSDDVEQSTDL